MLPVYARLTASRGFRAVYAKGRSYATDLIVVYVLPGPRGDRLRFGVVAGKKVGGAVERNRAKRLMREAARALLPNITGSRDIVIIARKKIGEAAFQEVRADMEKLLRRAGALSMPEE